jgi:hypothetical protein
MNPNPPNLTAAMDQMGAMFSNDVAPMLGQFYRRLLDEKFQPDQALALTQTFFQNMLRMSRPDSKEGPAK